MHASTKFWNRIATKSSKTLSPSSLRIISESKDYLNDESSVLDVGCGSGGISIEIASQVKTLNGIDISSKSIEYANEVAQEMGIENIHFHCGSIFDQSINHQKFDVIVCFNVLHYIDDDKAFYHRISNLLSHDGVFISSTACLAEKKSLASSLLHFGSFLKLLPKMNRFSEKGLVYGIKGCGFKIEKTLRISDIPELFIVAKNEVNKKS